MDTKLDVGGILHDTLGTLLANGLAAVVYVAGLSAVGIALDFSESQSSTPFSVANLVAGFLLLRAMLQKAGLLEWGSARRFGAYFGLSLLSGLGILIGFVLLVIPGLVLLARWLPAYAVLLSEEATVSDALGHSWERTRPHFWPILAAALLVTMLGLIGILVLALPELVPGVPMAVAIIAGNLLLTSGSALFTALGVAVYRQLGGIPDRLTEVFA